ncbi:BatA domain-containing protein [Emticicia sp. SJ17W-69]|uniref:BatA domain-containing protein n=1 Tax=Emticicia sp. SJ17W-69 TaxID=3421657 RepID=UPI003EBCB28C
MEFINPFMLWSTLAVAIPIILHFWHQKKGKLLNWAATSWLIEKNLQQSRGIRLENILLLLLRCLLLVILAFFLSKPIFNWLNNNDLAKKVHLVQANRLLVNNYKFELEEAQKKGEKIYWINSKTEQIDDISKMPSSQEFNTLMLQASINKVFQKNLKEQFELYFVNNESLNEVPNIFVPNKFSLHTIIDSLNFPAKPYLDFSNKRKLYINASNQLSSSFALDANGKFEQKPAHSGVINFLVENQNKVEKQAIEAALKALAEVYQIEIAIDFEKVLGKKYDFNFNENFAEEVSTLVFSGQLPEYLGEKLIKHYQLKTVQKPLSQQQLNSLFKISQHHSKLSEESGFSKVILLIFIIILGIERWVALKKNA